MIWFSSLIVTSFLLGVIHAFDYDHVAEMTDFVSQDPRPSKVIKFGIKFGLGHTTTVFIIGSVVLAFKYSLSVTFNSSWELFSGILLIALGMWSIYRRFLRKQKLKSEGQSQTKMDQMVFTYGPLLTGIVTGMAGTAGVLLFGPLNAVNTVTGAMVLIIFYGIGVTLTMVIYGVMVGRFFSWSYRWKYVSKGMWFLTGMSSLVIGVIWISRAVTILR
ncbi:hypothetical protein L1765_01820 [Microaerobacter geothermalis]|uniref:HoxN/HupN/NixA family nickel/cobalt transporter n=1 Tax=Microaerobacter geothermalis TaxID=674972 RepID=UPI001F30C561|nr:hypothetical protein [Microaerobacter geothermalis]MCF6092731.1 hypothetical protein [Microaerobacter geothermalis]